MSDKILIVEGEEQLRSRYQSELRALGYDVVTAGNSRGAIEKMKHKPVDLVILDLELPDSSGFDCLQKLMSVHRQVKVVINTACTSYKEDFHSWIADAFLTKSSDMNELKSTIDAVLHAKLNS